MFAHLLHTVKIGLANGKQLDFKSQTLNASNSANIVIARESHAIALTKIDGTLKLRFVS